MSWHGYIGFQDLALSSEQRATMTTVFRDIGYQGTEFAHYRNQYRVNLAGDMAIIEALFLDNEIALAQIRNYLADTFGVLVSSVSGVLTTPASGDLYTVTHGGTDYLRILFFGGSTSTWKVSRQKTRDYLSDNILEWEEPVI